MIGHQFGGGHEEYCHEVVGALGGGYAGNQVQARYRTEYLHHHTQQRVVKLSTISQEKMLSYDVTYKIGDQQAKSEW